MRPRFYPPPIHISDNQLFKKTILFRVCFLGERGGIVSVRGKREPMLETIVRVRGKREPILEITVRMRGNHEPMSETVIRRCGNHEPMSETVVRRCGKPNCARLFSHGRQPPALNPHCGLDPSNRKIRRCEASQSPKQKAIVFVYERWRIPVRHEG